MGKGFARLYVAALGVLVFWLQASVMDEMPPFPEKGSRLLEKLKKKDPKQARIHEDKPTGVDDMAEAKLPEVTNPVVPEVESKTVTRTHTHAYIRMHTHTYTHICTHTHAHKQHAQTTSTQKHYIHFLQSPPTSMYSHRIQ